MSRYQRPECYQPLAWEYVLGTMTGRARQRFQRLIQERVYIAEAVNQAEQRMLPALQRLTPIVPPKRVWNSINRELAARKKVDHKIAWPWASAAFASLSAFVFTLWLLLSAPAQVQPMMVAIVQSGDASTPAVMAQLVNGSAGDHSGRIVLTSSSLPAAPLGKDLEAWIVLNDQPAPVSVGVISRQGDKVVLELDADLWDKHGNLAAFALSVEPKGGSPTGQPTGPIVYQGEWSAI